jgi:hypothetical protein
MSVCCGCCVLSGTGLCDGLIARPEESYRVWCVCVRVRVSLSVITYNSNLLYLHRVGRIGQNKKKRVIKGQLNNVNPN